MEVPYNSEGFDPGNSLGPSLGLVGLVASEVPFSLLGLCSLFFRSKYKAAIAVPQTTARPPTTPPTIAPTLLLRREPLLSEASVTVSERVSDGVVSSVVLLEGPDVSAVNVSGPGFVNCGTLGVMKKVYVAATAPHAM